MSEYWVEAAAKLRPEQYRPVALDLRVPEQRLQITWADGVVSDFPLAFLRRHCPCALCRSERGTNESRPLLPILSAAPGGEARATGGEVVGHYAIRLDFADGHNTGIFDFRLLRLLHLESGSQPLP